MIATIQIVVAQKSNDKKKKGKIGYKMKMADARHSYLDGNIRGALNTYRELAKDFDNDAMIHYRTAECHYALKNYDLALEYYRNAKKVDSDLVPEQNYTLAQSLHRVGLLDQAISYAQTYKDNAKKKHLKIWDADKLMTQLEYAKKQIASPKEVTISNLGKNINSRHGDYSPSITADGQTLIFTSRRANTKGGGIDKAGDHKYFEDIYMSTWDKKKENWSRAEPIEGKLNTEGHDASLSISPDGNQIYIYRNDGSVYIGDIFVSKKSKSSGKWRTPKDLEKPINTSYFESSASLSADGNRLFFVSEREGKKNGAIGRGDIYVVNKISRTQWSEPKNLGPVINTKEDEISVFIHPNGKSLFFSSKGHEENMGGYDIFMSEFKDDSTWSKPINLGYPINTVDDDVHFVLGTDGKIAYYSTIREDGMGERDIYKIDMSKYPIIKDLKISLTILKGNISSTEGSTLQAEIIVSDEKGKQIGKTTANEYGDYFLTLPGNKKYFLRVNDSGYEMKKVEVELPLGEKETLSVEKNIVLTPNSN